MDIVHTDHLKCKTQAADCQAFTGFSGPNYTQIPDQALDELMARLSGAEWKVLCYIMRRTFGFKKDSDNISLNQIANGIRTKGGKQLDYGTGLSRRQVTSAIKSLAEKQVIITVHRSSAKKGYEPTTYRLRMRGDQEPEPEEREEHTTPPGAKISQGASEDTAQDPSAKISPGLGKKSNQTQETVKQETVNGVARRINLEVNLAREESTQEQDSTGHDLRGENQEDTETHINHIPEDTPHGIKSSGREAVTSRKVASRTQPDARTSNGGQARQYEDIDLTGSEWLRDSNTKPDLNKLSGERLAELNVVMRAAADFGREFQDPNPRGAVVAMGNLFLRSGRSSNEFYDVMLLTRQELRIVQQHQKPGQFIRNKGAYFYASVKNNLQRLHPHDTAREARGRPVSDSDPQSSVSIPPQQNGPFKGRQTRNTEEAIRYAS